MKNVLILIIIIVFYNSSSFSQEVKITETRYNCLGDDGVHHPFHTYCYSIYNNDSSRIALFFVEDDNTTIPHMKLLERKLYRPYGDFSLSMFELDHCYVKDPTYYLPEFFVKILYPDESFSIYVYADTSQNEIPVDFSRHLLICKEQDLSKISLPHFLSTIQSFKLDYAFPYVIISENSFKKFISRKR